MKKSTSEAEMKSYMAIQMAVEAGREVPNEGRSMGAVRVMAVTPRKEYLLLLCTQYTVLIMCTLIYAL